MVAGVPATPSGCQPTDWWRSSQSGIPNAFEEVAIEVIQRIARIADDVAWQAGVGGMETAGSFVSYLALHPGQVMDFLSGRAGCVDWPSKWHLDGCLSWHGTDGKVHNPPEASAIEARSDATGTGAAEGESAVPTADAQDGDA